MYKENMHALVEPAGIPTTEEIVDKVVDGKAEIFEEIILRYKKDVATIVRRRIPLDYFEDVMQEIFIRAYRNLGTWRRDKPFRFWLSGIAVRACCDHWRKQYSNKCKSYVSLNDAHLQWVEKAVAEQSCGKYEEGVCSQEAREILDNCLGKLKPDDRMALTLTYFDGYSVKETAQLLGWTTYNVKVRTFRARKKMKKLLSGLIQGRRT